MRAPAPELEKLVEDLQRAFDEFVLLVGPGP
jgi:hypothetical protein